ncbi:MAG: hypothetical protein EXQ95_00060 [Alphaproteobacteria bacterium]|nr:hypothetical protein [Alphaproteobacteria bacterium]
MIRHPILGSVDPGHVIMSWHVGARRRPGLSAARPEFLTVLPRGLASFLQVAESTSTAAEYLRTYVDVLLLADEASLVPAVLEVHWLANRHFELYIGRKPWAKGDRRSGNWLIMSNLREDEHLDARLTLLSLIEAVQGAAHDRGFAVAFDRIAGGRGPMVRISR